MNVIKCLSPFIIAHECPHLYRQTGREPESTRGVTKPTLLDLPNNVRKYWPTRWSKDVLSMAVLLYLNQTIHRRTSIWCAFLRVTAPRWLRIRSVVVRCYSQVDPLGQHSCTADAVIEHCECPLYGSTTTQCADKVTIKPDPNTPSAP